MNRRQLVLLLTLTFAAFASARAGEPGMSRKSHPLQGGKRLRAVREEIINPGVHCDTFIDLEEPPAPYQDYTVCSICKASAGRDRNLIQIPAGGELTLIGRAQAVYYPTGGQHFEFKGNVDALVDGKPERVGITFACNNGWFDDTFARLKKIKTALRLISPVFVPVDAP